MVQPAKYIQPTRGTMHNYTLIAYPDEQTSQKIRFEKELFADTYLSQGDTIAKPGITIASFLAFEAMEDTLLRYLHRIIKNQRSFEILLNNFSGFPLHSVYFRVQNPEVIQSLGKELKVIQDYLLSCSCPPLKRVNKPHLCLAAGLPEPIYFKAMSDYSRKSFHESFMVEQLVLVRKNNGYEPSKPINIFPLHCAECLPGQHFYQK